VSDDLDEVAGQLAQPTMKIASTGRHPLVRAGEERDDLLGQAMGVLGVLVTMPSTLGGLFRMPDPSRPAGSTSRRPASAATGPSPMSTW
jgi:hypothetical protein